MKLMNEGIRILTYYITLSFFNLNKIIKNYFKKFFLIKYQKYPDSHLFFNIL